ncbi:hypothetical protein RJ639_023933 [Escallonia herrerae]|uniref:Uncharacterized protein n=1 Tax=Escallonia herrerae TaxID=1293975 RepID=A0AA88V0V8_9ASTE|nr:hypothetical protein RJ639_023933 [Escallonia herrerae]
MPISIGQITSLVTMLPLITSVTWENFFRSTFLSAWFLPSGSRSTKGFVSNSFQLVSLRHNQQSTANFLFINGRLTFKRIIMNNSTEEFSGIPYMMTLLNCLLATW